MLTRLPRAVVAAATIGLTVGLAACSGSSSPSNPPSTAPGPSSSSPSPSDPSEQLQQLAELGNTASFHATYVVRESHPSSRAEWQVWRTPDSLRVDVVTKISTATLISTPHATFSCNRAPHHRACFRVASAGKPTPAALHLLAVRLFTSDLVGLAQHPEQYGIAAAPAGSITVPTHGGTCFHLTVPKETGGIDTGSYCFDANGVLTVVAYPNGNVVRLTALAMRAPRSSVFVPYSSPTPLPQ